MARKAKLGAALVNKKNSHYLLAQPPFSGDERIIILVKHSKRREVAAGNEKSGLYYMKG